MQNSCVDIRGPEFERLNLNTEFSKDQFCLVFRITEISEQLQRLKNHARNFFKNGRQSCGGLSRDNGVYQKISSFLCFLKHLTQGFFKKLQYTRDKFTTSSFSPNNCAAFVRILEIGPKFQ